MRSLLSGLLAISSGILASATSAPTCGQGERLLKNDILPDNPSGQYTSTLNEA